MKKSIFLLVVVAFMLQSCAKIFYTPDARSLAQNQKIIAIAPPKVSIAAKKNIDGAALIEQQKTESVNFQREMYSWMLKRKMQGTISVEIQDVETTIALLTKAGVNEGKILTPDEMCQFTWSGRNFNIKLFLIQANVGGCSNSCWFSWWYNGNYKRSYCVIIYT